MCKISCFSISRDRYNMEIKLCLYQHGYKNVHVETAMHYLIS